jgi:hypothetical protein
MSTAVIGAVTQSSYTVSFSGSASDVLKSLIPYLFFNHLPILGVFIVLGLSLLALKMKRQSPLQHLCPHFLASAWCSPE